MEVGYFPKSQPFKPPPPPPQTPLRGLVKGGEAGKERVDFRVLSAIRTQERIPGSESSLHPSAPSLPQFGGTGIFFPPFFFFSQGYYCAGLGSGEGAPPKGPEGGGKKMRRKWHAGKATPQPPTPPAPHPGPHPRNWLKSRPKPLPSPSAQKKNGVCTYVFSRFKFFCIRFFFSFWFLLWNPYFFLKKEKNLNN